MSQVVPPNITSQIATALTIRYRDGYRVASLINGFGRLVKVVGAISAAALFLVVVLPALRVGQAIGSNELGPVLLALMPAAGVFLAAFVVGTLLSAQGQVLMAQLDTAVSTSPFLSEVERLQAMGLLPGNVTPARGPQESVPVAPAPTETVAEKPRMCPVCLKEAASNGIRFCENCGAPLGE